jgi:hypothetical protein
MHRSSLPEITIVVLVLPVFLFVIMHATDYLSSIYCGLYFSFSFTIKHPVSMLHFVPCFTMAPDEHDLYRESMVSTDNDDDGEDNSSDSSDAW